MLPTSWDASQLLRRLGVDAVDIADTLAARPSADDPVVTWLVEETIASMGVAVSIAGHRGWPGQPDTPVGRHVPVWAYLALVPYVLEFHRSRRTSAAPRWLAAV
ncbi:acyltransferase domain-containing protein [Tenggerimyces flavus]|uniref:Acyltransferase domain-containing protein n=1 Tax=Tenggerimyces flavus TaxID=1708749 RepID=A0ABV7Y4I8_9ACTN|nr:acyltransferase domain-containing protein [Tenggerimyces flavus]MBM7788274.1 hypothetical protein [Tenggerimyces flavus]